MTESISEIVSSLILRSRQFHGDDNKSSRTNNNDIQSTDKLGKVLGRDFIKSQDNDSSTSKKQEEYEVTSLECLLSQLEKGYARLTQLSPMYDLSPDCPANGFRSLSKVTLKLLNVLENRMNRTSATDDKTLMLITNTISVINQVMEMMFLLDEKRKEGNFGPLDFLGRREKDESHATSVMDRQIVEMLVSIPGKSLEAFYSLDTFWLNKSLNFYHLFFKSLIAGKTTTPNPHNLGKVVFSPKYVRRLYFDFCYSCNVHQLRKSWSFTGKSFMKPVLSLTNGFGPKIAKKVHVPRQTTFRVIDSHSVIISDENNNSNNANRSRHESPPVSCLFLKDGSFGVSPNDSLVIHIHGGGYVSMNPRSHEMYLRKWAKKIDGVPILSIDYSLSPENEFPVALQEILDVYLFFSRNHSDINQIRDAIGFTPRNLILVGDSAGSNLSLCLLQVIIEVNSRLDREFIPLPKSLFLPYPHTNPSAMRMTPSRLLMTFDPVLSIGVILALSEGYHPRPEKPHKSSEEETVWYRKSRSSFIERLEGMEKLDMGPFFNPMVGVFDSQALKRIPLITVVGEFDPLLDESLSLTAKWQGPKKIDVLEGLTHGFLFCGMFSQDARKAINFCADRLREAIGLPLRSS